RWKGENVSTSEVASVIAAYPGISDAVVFGVAVPGADGRAGMAALVAPSDLDLVAFRRYLAAGLPDYARPVFLRLISNIEITGTFKLRKQEPSAEGYDHTRITDPLYFDDRQQQAYVRLDGTLYARLQEGAVRI